MESSSWKLTLGPPGSVSEVQDEAREEENGEGELERKDEREKSETSIGNTGIYGEGGSR